MLHCISEFFLICAAVSKLATQRLSPHEPHSLRVTFTRLATSELATTDAGLDG